MTHEFDKPPRLPKALKLLAFAGFRIIALAGVLIAGSTTSIAESTSIDPNQLVLEAVNCAIWGPSLSCRIRQHSVSGAHRLEAEGHYWQMGQGTGQLKMTLDLKADQQAPSSWIQVSDGRLLWTSIGGGEPPRRVYLDRVRQSLGALAREPNLHPEAALYLAIGGQAEALRCLYFRYRWFKIYKGTDQHGRIVWQLQGRLRTEIPSPSSSTKIDGLLAMPTPPPEIPTDVLLTLGSEGKLKYFPYRIDYYIRELGEGGQPGKYVRVSTVERDEVESPISVAQDFFHFQVPDEADQIVDETSDYLPLLPQANAGPVIRR